MPNDIPWSVAIIAWLVIILAVVFSTIPRKEKEKEEVYESEEVETSYVIQEDPEFTAADYYAHRLRADAESSAPFKSAAPDISPVTDD